MHTQAVLRRGLAGRAASTFALTCGFGGTSAVTAALAPMTVPFLG